MSVQGENRGCAFVTVPVAGRGVHVMKNVCRVLLFLAGCAAASDACAETTAAVRRVGGVPRIVLNGKPASGTAVMPALLVPPGASVETLKSFRRAGVRFSSDVWTMSSRLYLKRQWWLGEGKYDFKLFDAMAMGLLDASDDGYIFPRIKIDPPTSWLEAHPEEMFEGKVKADSKAWRALYRRMLKDMIRHVEASPYADRVIGYHIGAMHCGEWLVYPINFKRAFSPLKGRTNDPLSPLENNAERRAEVAALAMAVADATIDSCRYVRELTGGKKLVGAFSGYMGLSHMAAGKVFASGAVDFIAAPPYYSKAREPGSAGISQSPFTASMRLNNIVFYEESDFRTYLSNPAAAPKSMTRCRPLDEALALMRRSIGRRLCEGYENWWFLIGGNETCSHPEMMKTIARGVELSGASLERDRRTPAEVAVFTAADEFTTCWAFPNGAFHRAFKFGLLRDVLPHCGVPYDSYELNDIGNPDLPDYKVYVFPNAFMLTDARRAEITAAVRRKGKTAVWLYAPGYFRNGEGALANVEDLTGIRLKELEGVRNHPAPRVFGAVGSPVVERDGWRSVYAAKPPDAGGWRKIFREAGAHVWIETPDVLTAGRGFVMLHASQDGAKTVRLPAAKSVSEVFGLSPARGRTTEITETLRRGETRVYRLEDVKGADRE